MYQCYVNKDNFHRSLETQHAFYFVMTCWSRISKYFILLLFIRYDFCFLVLLDILINKYYLSEKPHPCTKHARTHDHGTTTTKQEQQQKREKNVILHVYF